MNENIFNNLIITKIYSVNKYFTNTKDKNSRTNRSSWAIIIKVEGETRYKSKTQDIISNIKNLVILPRSISYSWVCEKAGFFYVIEFDTNMEYNQIISCNFEETDLIVDIFEEMINEKNKLDIFSNLKIFQLTYKLLYVLLKNNIAPELTSKSQKIIMPAIKYINANLDKEISNETLAKLCYISTSYFRKLFTSVFKTSPAHYITDLRIQRAKELLHSDFISISKIAEQVGYYDVYHFSKIFKQKTGLSPLNYLKKHK